MTPAEFMAADLSASLVALDEEEGMNRLSRDVVLDLPLVVVDGEFKSPPPTFPALLVSRKGTGLLAAAGASNVGVVAPNDLPDHFLSLAIPPFEPDVVCSPQPSTLCWLEVALPELSFLTIPGPVEGVEVAAPALLLAPAAEPRLPEAEAPPSESLSAELPDLSLMSEGGPPPMRLMIWPWGGLDGVG